MPFTPLNAGNIGSASQPGPASRTSTPSSGFKPLSSFGGGNSSAPNMADPVQNNPAAKQALTQHLSSIIGNTNQSFQGTDSTPQTTTTSMTDVAKGVGKGALLAGKSMVNGTVESGKDIAAALGGSDYIDKLSKLSDGDQQFITHMIQLKNKNLASGNTAAAQHFADQLKNYQTTTGESATDVFPALAKSNEQVLGDFGSMGLELTGGGSLATSGAEKAAQVANEGLPLAERVLQGIKTGGKYGAAFGLTGGMQANKDAAGLVESTAGGALAGAAMGGATEGILGKRPVTETATKDASSIDKTIGQIIQGDPKDIPKAKVALSNVDTSNVKTYKDLGGVLSDRVKELSAAQDKLLATKPETIPMNQLQMKMKAGDQEVSHNYVQDAIGQLKDYYSKTNDVKGLSEITQLEQKASSEGLNVKEVNDLARLHGSELNAYNLNGELASGATKQAIENTRSGLKGTVRQQMGDKASQAIDSEMTNVIKTRDLVGDMAEKVNALRQKIQERSLGAKVGQKIGQVINLVGLGTPKGIVESLIPRGQGFKVMNALDLEKALQKNLSKVQDILDSDMSEGTVSSKLDALIKSIGQTMLKSPDDIPNKSGGFIRNPLAGETAPHINPEAVASNMSAEDMQLARKIVSGNDLNSYISAEPMLKAMGIDKLGITDQMRFLQEAIDSGTKKIPILSK